MKVTKQADTKLNLYRNKTTSNNAMVKYGLLVFLKNKNMLLVSVEDLSFSKGKTTTTKFLLLSS